jgi:predicted  nucleic acid-binding Zn-ribbon protein
MPSDPKMPVTLSFLTSVMRRVAQETGKTIREYIAPRDAKIAALEAKLAEAKMNLESFERRASRHADHLARLESRMKAIEHR